MASEEIEGEVKMSPLEQLLEAWSRVRGWYPVNIEGRSFRCDPDHISFWNRVGSRDWEPQTFAVLSSLLNPEVVYCDIGAWIGPTVLHAACCCRKVYCFEPDRTAYMYLLQNLRLNHLENVLPFNIALADRAGICRMASPRGKRGDSLTSLLCHDGRGASDVFCLPWQTWLGLAGNPEIEVIKMDIEGGEFALLPSMAEYLRTRRPKLYLSLHPHRLPENERPAAMRAVVDVLRMYRGYYDSRGTRYEIQSLLEEQQLHHAGTCLLLPS
jgi:FkbM family methyltransferase